MNRSQLKWFSIITMLIDHIGILLKPVISLETYCLLRIIGRISFPIFAYLLVDGFIRTKNYNKYLSRIFLFAIISEPLHSYFLYQNIFAAGLNVLFTFFFSLIVLKLLQIAKENRPIKSIVCLIGIITVTGLTYLLECEYSYKAIFIILLFYIFKDKTLIRNLMVIAVLLITNSWIGWFSIFALVPIYLYNNQPSKFPKWFGYAFYPLHLIVLIVIKIIFI